MAASYIGDKGKPVLFRFEVGDIDRGASISFLSQYPNEEEILIPPLSYLEVIGEPFFMETDKGDVKVYHARINCNLKSQTIEEIVAHRQKEVLAMLPYLDGTLRRDLSLVAAAMVADHEKAIEAMMAGGPIIGGLEGFGDFGRRTKFGMSVDTVLAAKDGDNKGVVTCVITPLETYDEDGRCRRRYRLYHHEALRQMKMKEVHVTIEELQAQILSEFDALGRGLMTTEKITWLNQDANYKQAIMDVIDFREPALVRLITACERRTFFTTARERERERDLLGNNVQRDGISPLCTACHLGYLKTVEALVSSGEAVDERTFSWGMTALMWASMKGDTELVRLLLDLGAEVNLRDEDGRTALMCTHVVGLSRRPLGLPSVSSGERSATSPQSLEIKALLQAHGATGGDSYQDSDNYHPGVSLV